MPRASAFVVWLLSAAWPAPAARVERSVPLSTQERSSALAHEGGAAAASDGFAGLRRLPARLELPGGLTPRVLEFLPIRFYFIAAAGGASAYIWEVAVPAFGGLGEPRAELVRKVQVPEGEAIHALTFVPGHDLLMARAYGVNNSKRTVFWDTRSGLEALSFPGAEVIAMSSDGERGVGSTFVSDGVGDLRPGSGVWDLRAGTSADVLLPLGCQGVFCRTAVFSPDGKEVAVAVMHQVTGGFGALFRVEIWDSGTGEVRCSLPVPMTGETMAFDGSRVELCNGADRPGASLRLLRHGDGRCQLSLDRFEHCEDVHLPREFALHLGGRQVSVRRLAGGAYAHVAFVPWSEVVVRGAFAPDGRSALLGVRLQGLGVDLHLFVWRFADGRPPERLARDLLWRPGFSADGALLATIVRGGRFLALHDLRRDGPDLRLHAAGEEFVSVAASDARAW